MIELCPMTLKEANAYVEQHHRHHGPVVGHKFSIGLSDGEKIVGVAIVGRPVARHLDDGWTLEVNRLCTDGTRNACSMLYSAAWRAARAMGYKRLVTYILDTENGASLRASGIQRSWCGAKSAATWRSLAVTGNVAVATWALCARMIIAAGDGDEKKAPDNSASGSGRAGDRRGLAG